MSQRPHTGHPISRIPRPIIREAASTWQFKDIPNWRQILHDLVSRPEKRRIEYLEGCLHSHCNHRNRVIRTPEMEARGSNSRCPPPFRNVCNTSVIMYEVYKPKSAKSPSKRFEWGPLLELWFKAQPRLLLEDRRFFAAGKWLFSEDGDINDRIDGLVAEHLAWCDWIDKRFAVLSPRNGRNRLLPGNSGPYIALDFDVLDESHMFLPTMRAIMMIYWPTVLVALVLTGDYSQMKSGPISWGRLWNDRLPGYNNTERVVYVKPERAVAFLAWIDRREVAANAELKVRNENAARKLERSFVGME